MYLDRLAATNNDDFCGLIDKAISHIDAGTTLFLRKQGSGDLKRIRFVSIDEYQDFSKLFYELIAAIRRQNPAVELFCVGDDWQATNGFAGSDLTYYRNFTRDYSPASVCNLVANYRSDENIVLAANQLMGERGASSIPIRTASGTVLLADLAGFVHTDEEKKFGNDCITPAVLRLVKVAIKKGHKVLLLARKNYLPWYYDRSGKSSNDLETFCKYVRSHLPLEGGQRELVEARTVHSSKGLEADTVVVLDAVDRHYPLIHHSWVLNRVFGDSISQLIDDERRLLYVAQTRAKHELFIVTEASQVSLFLEESHMLKVDWAQYHELAGGKPLPYTVCVKGAPSCQGGGTFPIKEHLKANKYTWDKTKQLWWKKLPKELALVDELRVEGWSSEAVCVQVEVRNSQNVIVQCYRVDKGVWQPQRTSEDWDIPF